MCYSFIWTYAEEHAMKVKDIVLEEYHFTLPLFGLDNMVLLKLNIHIAPFYSMPCESYKETEKVYSSHNAFTYRHQWPI